MTGGFDRILDELVVRHGGDEKLGLSGLAVCRSIASLLASDDLDAAGARTIASLQSLLPGQPDEADLAVDEWDLGRLGDDELQALQTMLESVAARCRTAEPLPTLSDKLCEVHASYQRTLSELASERELRNRTETSMHASRSELVRVEQDLAKHRAALTEVARALAEAEAAGKAADEDASYASPGGPNGTATVVKLVRPRTPAESPDCEPVTDVSNYDFLEVGGSGSDRFDFRR
jgi:hypothetical protein